MVVGMSAAQAAPRAAGKAPAPALFFATLSVSPHGGLVDGQPVRVHIGGSSGTTYAVAECDSKTVPLLSEPSSSLQDGCDNRNSTVATVGAHGSATLYLDLAAVLTTSLGPEDCLTHRCFLAIFALHRERASPGRVQSEDGQEAPMGEAILRSQGGGENSGQIEVQSR